MQNMQSIGGGALALECRFVYFRMGIYTEYAWYVKYVGGGIPLSLVIGFYNMHISWIREICWICVGGGVLGIFGGWILA